MKIIKPPEEFKPLPLTCKHCAAELLADSPEDFRRCAGSDSRDSWDYAVTMCPCCRGSIHVKPEHFQPHIYSTIKGV